MYSLSKLTPKSALSKSLALSSLLLNHETEMHPLQKLFLTLTSASLFLISLGGCATNKELLTKTETVTVYVPVDTKIPAEDFQHCLPAVKISEAGPLPVGDVTNLTEDLLVLLRACNDRLDAIKGIVAKEKPAP